MGKFLYKNYKLLKKINLYIHELL